MSFEVTLTPTVYNVEVEVNPSVQPFDVVVEVGNVPDLDLTTNGDSGASTFNPLTGELNIPEYTLGGLGGVPESRTLTINGTTQDLSANRTFTIPTHDAITIGTANGLSLAGQVLSLGLASSIANGALSSTDWATFNGKQNALGFTAENVANKAINLTSPDDTKYPTTLAVSTALAGKQDTLTNPITGTGTLTSGRIAISSGSNTLTDSERLVWNGTNALDLGTGLTFRVRSASTATFLSSTTGLFYLRPLGDLDATNQILISSLGIAINGTSAAAMLDVYGTGRIRNGVSLAWNTGNVQIGTTTDAGFRLDVNGTARVQGALTVTTGGASITGLSTIQGTTASDSGQLGAELLTTGSSDASWTGSSFATGYTHVAGSVTTLTSTLAGIVNTFYQITYTVTGRTAGSFTIAFGGQSFAGLTATGAVGPRATTTDTLVITPTSDFNGTIVLSIRVITASSASVTFNNSAGTVTNQIRISSIDSNTFFGRSSGSRSTTGSQNTFFGAGSGEFNTSGFNNTFVGRASGSVNTTGGENSFFGRNSGLNNTTGTFNCFFGNSSGSGNTTGSNNSFFGLQSGQSNNGSTNSFFGNLSGLNNTSGSANTAIGTSSGLNNTTGSENVFIGSNSGRFIANGSTALTITSNSVFLGSNSRANADSETNQIVIGHTAIGAGSNTATLGNTSIVDTILRGRINIQQYATGSRPPYVKGSLIYDSTLSKLVVGGAIGWEVVTSI